MSHTGDYVVIPGEWHLRYRWAAGKTATEFFRRLREKEIAGTKCPKCQLVMLPPRGYCERCFVETNEWVRVGQEGQIESFTVVYEAFDGLPDPPYVIGIVLLDGAGTGIVNFIEGVDLSNPREAARKLAVGTRVKVAFKPNPEGRVTDFVFRVMDS